MPMGVAAHQTPEEEAALDALRDDPQAATDEPPPDDGGEASTASEQTGDAPTGEASEGADKPGDKPGAPADKTAADDKPKGEPRAALRAARRGEQRARERAERAEAELAELKKRLPADASPATGTDDISDEELAALEADFPVVAKAIKATRKAVAAAPAQPTTSAASGNDAASDFTPPELPPAVQELVDDFPDLLAWQHDPDQTRFNLAKATDAVLQNHPKWKDASDEERFAEVVRRVNAEIPSATPTQDPPEDAADAAKRQARERIDSAQRRNPASIADIGGGGGRPNEGSSLSRFMHMGEDEALAELEREG